MTGEGTIACPLMEWTHLVRGDFKEGLVWEAKSLAAFQRDLDVVDCVWTRTGAAWVHALQGHWQQALDDLFARLRRTRCAHGVRRLGFKRLISATAPERLWTD